MEEKRRSKRPKPAEEGLWECTVCTYRNSPEAFKCDMCDVRKGTSTRKPRLNPSLVAQQVAQQFLPPAVQKEKKDRKDKKDKERNNNASTSHKKGSRVPRLKNIDRSTAHSMEVTVGNVTVIITDYKLKKERTSAASEHQGEDSNSSMSMESNSNSMDTSDIKGDDQQDESNIEKADIEMDLKS